MPSLRADAAVTVRAAATAPAGTPHTPATWTRVVDRGPGSGVAGARVSSRRHGVTARSAEVDAAPASPAGSIETKPVTATMSASPNFAMDGASIDARPPRSGRRVATVLMSAIIGSPHPEREERRGAGPRVVTSASHSRGGETGQLEHDRLHRRTRNARTIR